MNIQSMLWVPILASACGAQGFVSSPPGFLTTAGGDDAHNFGAYSYGRYLIVDGEYRKRSMSLKGVDFRPLPSQPSQGRTFPNIRLDVSECDFDKVDWFANKGVTFSSVPLVPSKNVFSSQVTFPATNQSSPLAWRVQFPFHTAWLHTGKLDICLDYTFTGGTLSGGTVPWFKQHVVPYYTDATPMEFENVRLGTRYYGPRYCQDTKGQSGSDIALNMASYGPMYPTLPAQRDTTFATLRTYTAGNTKIVHMLSLAGSTTPIPTPLVKCQDLYLDLSKPALLFFTQSPSGGTDYLNLRMKYDARWADTRVWGQSAWADSQTAELKLTQYTWCLIPGLPEFYRRGAVEYWDGWNPVGRPGLESHLVPLVRYTR